VLAVKTKTLPVWDEKLAGRIRDGMSLAELDGEVRKALEGDNASNQENARNDALAAALLEITSISKIPESLVEENTQQRFQEMLMDFKQQGSTDEQLQEMASPENYQRYKVNNSSSSGSAERQIGLLLLHCRTAERMQLVARVSRIFVLEFLLYKYTYPLLVLAG
jgi:FKBP-type peptidyl-prolyl cis-trans isomerase (trigger factor)